MRFAYLLALLVASTPALAAGESLSVEIFYTGRLMGHARYPDRQKVLETECGKDCTPSDEAASLIALLRDNGFTGGPDQLLLGLGDNLGPNYAARTMEDRAKRAVFKDHFIWMEDTGWFDIRLPGNAARLDRYAKDEKHGRTKIPFDNVAEFFRRAGYHAIVPGKHDFTFGPERLRQIERWLRDRKSTALLGANLRIQTTRHKPPAKVAERFRVRHYVTTDKTISISLPKTIYPWARKFTVSGLVRYVEDGREIPPEDLVRWTVDQVHQGELTLFRSQLDPRKVQWEQRSARVKVCEAAEGAPEAIDLKSCTLATAPSMKPALCKAVPVSATFEFARKLQADANYAVCIFRDGEKPLCSPFSVAQPFWTWGRETETPPYYRVEGKNIVVFGVLDPALKASLPVPNAGWRNTSADFDSVVAITDEKEAFDQAFDKCRADGKCPDGVQRILLAQMPEERAAALARRIGGSFLAVISEANTRQPTPEQTITRAEQGRPIVVSPGPIYTPTRPNHLQILVQRFKVEQLQLGAGFRFTHNVFRDELPYHPFDRVLSPNRRKLGEGGARPTLGQLSLAFLKKSGLTDADLQGRSQAWIAERAILLSMRRRTTADVALLQKRDLFRLPDIVDREIGSGQLPEVLDRLLWKGDFLLKITVKGSVLEAAMTRSAELAELDRDPNKVDTEEGRWLLMAGIYREPVSKTWYVNGAALDKARLYSVALPDYLAFGDTSYPQFKNADGLGPARIRDEPDLTGLTDMVCPDLGGTGERCLETGNLDLSASTLLDAIAHKPPDRKADDSPAGRISSRFRERLVPDSIFKDAAADEKKAQGRRVVSIALEKLEGGFSKYSHNAATERERTDRFAGINSPPVVQTPESANLNPSARIRARVNGERGDFFLLVEENLNRVLTRNVMTERFVTDLKQNTWGFELGRYARVFRRGLHRPEWTVLASIRHERNILTPPPARVSFGSGAVQFDLRRAFSTAGRFGIRWDRGDNINWLEGGFQVGRRSQLLSSIRFASAEAGREFTCSAAGAGPDSLAACATAGSNPGGVAENPAAWTAHPVYDRRWRDGPFLRYRIDWPVLGWKELAFVSEGNLEYYRSRAMDVSTDTRLFADWSAAFRLKLWENLGIGPKYQLIYFDNKVQRSSIAAHNVTFGVEYRFEWRPGIALGKALRVPYPPK